MAHGPRGGPAGTTALDEIAKAIIEQLQADGRQSYAASCRSSPSPTRCGWASAARR
jgi:hypothetical protein